MHPTRSPCSDVRREPRSSCLPCSSSGQRVLPKDRTVLLEKTNEAAGALSTAGVPVKKKQEKRNEYATKKVRFETFARDGGLAGACGARWNGPAGMRPG